MSNAVTTPAPAGGGAPEPKTIRDAFDALKGAVDYRLKVRQTLLNACGRLSAVVVSALRQANIFNVEEWEGGFSFDVGEFSFAAQLAEFDDGRKWPLMLFVQHEEAGFWKPVEAVSQIFLTLDAPDKVVFGGTALTPEDFARKALFPILQRSVEAYTITEQDEETGWDDAEIWPQG